MVKKEIFAYQTVPSVLMLISLPARKRQDNASEKKDIYGNLIYEGDLVCIVEYGDYDWERAIKRKQKVRKIKNLKIPSYNEPAFINLNHSQIIVWDNKRATFMMKDRINSTGRPESLCNKRYVIVGHIYENPELLESEER